MICVHSKELRILYHSNTKYNYWRVDDPKAYNTASELTVITYSEASRSLLPTPEALW